MLFLTRKIKQKRLSTLYILGDVFPAGQSAAWIMLLFPYGSAIGWWKQEDSEPDSIYPGMDFDAF